MIRHLAENYAVRKPAYSALVEKSQAACVAAIETYNRAASEYREENFAILMINAWELLFKARIMQENGGKVNSIYEMVPRKNKDGTPSKKKTAKLTRSKLPHTISLEKAYNICAGYTKNNVDAACIANIETLLEIRDSATHFVVSDPHLRKRLSEIALGAVRNYVVAAQRWFDLSFAHLNIASIPLSFDLDQKQLYAAAKNKHRAVAAFLAHVEHREAVAAEVPSDFFYSVRVHFDLVKGKESAPLKVAQVGLKDKPDYTFAIDSNKVPDGFEWEYNTLCTKMLERYSDFKTNNRFHQARRKLESDTKLCHIRYLDPKRKTMPKKYYNSNIMNVFDNMYRKK